MRMPVVAIVGRPNVGKSSLLNALSHKRVSIVQDQPGVTRDRVSIPFQVNGKWVELVDTGGYGFDDSQGLTEHIKHQIELAMGRANLVLFIVDAHDGLLDGDRTIARLLREKGVKTQILANKTDGAKYEQALGDFATIGLGTPMGVSATTSYNLDKIPDVIASNLDLSEAPTEIPEPELLVAIVGKRNAGKSTFVNAVSTLFEDEPDRVIVSEVPGTTRDSVDIRFEKDGKTLVVIDTAGVRKKRHMVNDDVEFYSFHRAERSIRRADVVLQLIDGVETISEPDKKLTHYVLEQYKPVIVVINKWDLALAKARENAGGEAIDDHELREKYREYVNAELRGASFAPLAFITAKDQRNVGRVVDLARKLHKQATVRLTTSKLNEAMEQVLAERTPSGTGRGRPKVYYATQVGIAPPTIVLFVNKAEYFNESYRRFVVNRFRELLPFGEVPIKLEVRERTREQRGTDSTRPSVKERAKANPRPRKSKESKERKKRDED
ncbi:MAG: ribosome biogenesis GTPase Der [Tepidisphaeraceae bacterium]